MKKTTLIEGTGLITEGAGAARMGVAVALLLSLVTPLFAGTLGRASAAISQGDYSAAKHL